MDFSARALKNPATEKTDCLIVPCFSGGSFSKAPESLLNKASNNLIKKSAKTAGFKGANGSVLSQFHLPGITAQQVILLGLGDEKSSNKTALSCGKFQLELVFFDE